MTGTLSFEVQCKILPIDLDDGISESRKADNIAFFNLMADAIDSEIERLGQNGIWFESAKVHIDREKHEILFGYPKQLTTAILQRIFSIPFTMQDKTNLEFHGQYYHGFSEGIGYDEKSLASSKARLNFIDNKAEVFLEKNKKASAKCKDAAYLIAGSKHERLYHSVSLSRERLFGRPQEGEADYLRKNFQSCDFLFYGENQQPQPGTTQRSCGHDYILNHMEALKESGVTKVYSEYFLKDQQPLIDYYFEDKENAIPIELEQYALAMGGNTLAFLRALKENNIQLVGLENTASTNGSAYKADFRTGSFNHHAVKTIRENHQPGEKSIIEVAGAQLLASISLHNLLNVSGFYPRFGQ